MRRIDGIARAALYPGTAALAAFGRSSCASFRRKPAAAMVFPIYATMLASIGIAETPACADVRASTTCTTGRSIAPAMARTFGPARQDQDMRKLPFGGPALISSMTDYENVPAPPRPNLPALERSCAVRGDEA